VKFGVKKANLTTLVGAGIARVRNPETRAFNAISL